MSLTRKASSAAKKATKPPRDKLAAALAEREAELAEARRQRTATSDILRAIASSPGDLQPVLDRLAEVSCHLCEAYDTLILLRDGDDLRFASHFGPVPLPRNFTKRRIAPDWPAGRAMVERRTIHAHDLAAAQDEYPFAVQFAKDAAGTPSIAWRSVLSVPLLREGEPVGVVALRRVEVWPFTQAQIELMESFVPQAVIAIENSRLFHEAQEALERQTATAEILRVISQSLTDARPVFERIVVTAVRLLHCDMGIVLLREGDTYVHAVGATQAGRITDLAPERFPIDPDANFPSRAILSKEMLYLPDWSRVDLPEHERNIRAEFGVNSALYLPLLREGECIGALALIGNRPNSFGSKEIAHGELFCDQALIAIENARLFHETQESLERQTATAEVLKVIAGSPSNVQPVFEAIAATANRLLGGLSTTVWRFVDDALVLVAFTRTSPSADEALQAAFPRPIAEFPPFALARDGETGQVIDTEAESGVPRVFRDLGRLRGFRSMLFGPLMNDGAAIGMISVTRREPGAFVPADVQLLRTFADQAVIAVNNVGLFNETRAALERQTATAEILRVISQSPTDARPVFERIVETASHVLRCEMAAVLLCEGDVFVTAAAMTTEGLVADVGRTRVSIDPNANFPSRAIVQKKAVHLPDWSLIELPEHEHKVQARWGINSALYLPLLREGECIGALALVSKTANAFGPEEIAQAESFRDQAVIAIENARLFAEVQARTRDLTEALQQQTATSDILRVIASSPGDLQPVLDKLAETACRLCGAYDALVLLREGDQLRAAAHYGPIPVTFASQEISRGLLAGRAVIERRAIHIDDIAKHADEYPVAAGLAARGAAAGGMFWRANLVMPLMREGEAVGVIGLRRAEAVPFSDGQIDLLKTFSDQAVIAIENVRLFDEVQARTRELSEALEHQTATSEVLSAISRSPTEVQPVFDAIAKSATELCGATSGGVDLFDGELIRLVAHYNWSPEALAAMGQIYPAAPGRGFASSRAILTRSVVHIPDISEDLEYTATGVVDLGFRSVLAVPMLRDGQPIGVIALVRLEPRAFTDRQIALLQTFAEQAVIAINNVRLFDEVQARTRDLTEALKQQTATADVLKVISRSAFDLDSVLRTLTDSARSLSGAATAAVFLRDGDVYPVRAESGVAPEFLEYLNAHPARPGKATLIGRVAMTGEPVRIPDVREDPDYDYGVGPHVGDYRSLFGAPLIRDGKVEGVFGLMHPKPFAFTPSQMEMVRAFADQAVIAIENVRLFDEVQARTREVEEALAQQTATADVLKVISRSAFDLQTVLDTLASSAAGLIGANFVAMYLRRGDVIHPDATYGASPEMVRYMREHPQRPGEETAAGRVFQTGEVQNISDVLADPNYDYGEGPRLGNFRALLGVPMVRDGKVEGSFTLGRAQPGPFTQRQIELVQTFADQAIIAIENVRLFDEVQARTKDLQEALQLQTATSEVLKVISRSAFDLQIVFDTLTASAVELCSAFSGSICVRDGEIYRYRGNAGPGISAAMSQYLAEHPATPGRGSIVGRVLLLGKVEEIQDVLEDADYVVPLGAHGQASRALLGVPLLGKDGIEGALVLTREEPGHFSDRQIEIVQTFADQAVIAIENVRLFEQVQARTRELSASLEDLRKAQDRLIQSEKLASLGQLTAGIAHEIKNPLNFVNNFSALSRELVGELADVIKTGPLDDARRGEAEELIATIDGNLDKVVQHGKRADSIVKNMLLHSREGSGERSAANVNAMVEEALNLAYHGARAEKPGFNVTIAKSLDPNAGEADVYAQEMTRVLLNLISNGFYATAKRKQAAAEGTYEPTLTASTRDLGHSVEIAIRDNGIGIPGEVKAKMFNPFFTTKPAGEGTGLGLSLSHDIVVKQHGGTIEVSTEPGAYTQFTVVLPRAGARA